MSPTGAVTSNVVARPPPTKTYPDAPSRSPRCRRVRKIGHLVGCGKRRVRGRLRDDPGGDQTGQDQCASNVHEHA